MALTKKEIEHIAELARIRLEEVEKEKLAHDLGAILGYIDKLKEVNTEGVDPVSNITGLENVFRKDERPAGAEAKKAEQLIGQSPATKDGYVKVKSVFEGK